ncbi:hypothetical protein BC827DRAFT_1154061 [Russula dissimulans]|nr:hypothetical protein BC827DRAFT_1154061 [Russula dissimulans]
MYPPHTLLRASLHLGTPSGLLSALPSQRRLNRPCGDLPVTETFYARIGTSWVPPQTGELLYPRPGFIGPKQADPSWVHAVCRSLGPSFGFWVGQIAEKVPVIYVRTSISGSWILFYVLLPAIRSPARLDLADYEKKGIFTSLLVTRSHGPAKMHAARAYGGGGGTIKRKRCPDSARALVPMYHVPRCIHETDRLIPGRVRGRDAKGNGMGVSPLVVITVIGAALTGKK